MELLPAGRGIRVAQPKARLDERTLQKHNAAIVVCPREGADGVLKQLPSATLWLKLYRDARSRGPVTLLSARVTPGAIPVVLAFAKSTASVFERLMLGARAWKELSAPPRARVLLATCGLEDEKTSVAALEAVLAASLAATAPMPVMKSKREKHSGASSFTLLNGDSALDTARTIAVDRGNHVARWLTALPPNVLNSSGYRRALRELARREGWQFDFLDEAALRRRSAGAFLAVARANQQRDAGIVRLRYRAPQRRNVRKVALVGKGICFDTGGINLKSHKSMYDMHTDMQGSAVAVGTLLALSELRAPYDIDCWLAITENEIGARAFRPQEVVRAANGVTIQVAHSDAEGRMVLADTLALAARERPELMIDFATLTGACVNALTERYSGAFTNRPQWHEALRAAGRSSGERVWPFPMDEDYDSDLDSSIADVLQCTPDGKGDHILAARFLNRFVPAELPWVHIDLAASNRSGGLGHVPTDITGFGVRYTVELLGNGELFANT
ncbi:MAG TPA: M17 family metallopeptidase [Steroidobacteraceae bacterium]|nr:M17 family metallopeptidase [Steroidobacteraceae bacterium]